MQAPVIELDIQAGASLSYALLWGDEEVVWVPIESMPSLTPVTFTVGSHTLVEDWPVEVVGATSPYQLNTPMDECAGQTPVYRARVLSSTQIALFNVGGLGWKPLAGNAQLKYNVPADITGWKARAGFRSADAPEDYALFLTSSNDADYAESDGEIEVDVARSRFVLTAPPAETAGMSGSGRWYVEVEDPSGRVYAAVAASPYRVLKELVI